jgi:hypothetical protein
LTLLLAAALVGVLHVHHAPSHDSDGDFSEVLAAAASAELDFVVLAEHADPEVDRGPLPASEHAGLHPRGDGGSVLVMVGVELGTLDGHLLAYDVSQLIPATDRPGRDVVADIHAAGGFAVVPHPFTHGGWHDWDAPFDGLEVHNNASAFRHFVGPLLPVHLVWLAFDRDAVMARMLVRPDRELARWDELSTAGRPVVAFSGADVHRNVSLLGWQLDPYAEMFRAVQTVCPEIPLEPAALWQALRTGRCWIRYALYDDRADEAVSVEISGRVELQLDDGARVLEVRNPIISLP